VASTHTSVPRWPRSDPGVDRSGVSYAVMSFSDVGATVARRWEAELVDAGAQVWSWHGAAVAEEALTELGTQVHAATVGWRLMLAGPETDVLRARAVAVAGGALDAEITILVSADERRRVWCAHCGQTTDAAVAVGEVVDCAGCGRSLLVYHHVSRRHAAYLGFLNDAEEMP
jgi:dimethylamine monooxygenase subunit C